MSNSIACDDPSIKVIVGVDTHKHEHVAVAINGLGARLATYRAPANRAGYADLVTWARPLGDVEAFGIEGTGSYGVGLASFVRRQGLRVVEVNRCDRRKRRNNGKRTTRSTPSRPRGRCSPASRPPFRRSLTGWQRWSGRSRSPAIRPSRRAVSR